MIRYATTIFSTLLVLGSSMNRIPARACMIPWSLRARAASGSRQVDRGSLESSIGGLGTWLIRDESSRARADETRPRPLSLGCFSGCRVHGWGQFFVFGTHAPLETARKQAGFLHACIQAQLFTGAAIALGTASSVTCLCSSKLVCLGL